MNKKHQVLKEIPFIDDTYTTDLSIMTSKGLLIPKTNKKTNETKTFEVFTFD